MSTIRLLCVKQSPVVHSLPRAHPGKASLQEGSVGAIARHKAIGKRSFICQGERLADERAGSTGGIEWLRV